MRAITALFAVLLAAAPLRADDLGGAKAPDKVVRTPEQLATLKKLVLEGLEDERAKTRAAAGDLLVAAWPDSAPILDEALAATSDGVRLEAVRLLGREELGDVRERIRGKFVDSDEKVRTHAVRAARRLEWPEVERDLAELLARERSWIVRQEVLRGFEDHGTAVCLAAVLCGWSSEQEADRRQRYKRVLIKIVGKDFGDDLDAWRTAVQEAGTKARAARADQKR